MKAREYPPRIDARDSMSLLLVCIVFLGFGSFVARAQPPGYIPGKLADREEIETYLTPPAQSDTKDQFWLVEPGVEIFHFVAGKGEEILYLHGGPGVAPAEMPEGLRRLGDRFQILCYHQRGCGRSTRPFDRFDSPNFMENMPALVETLGLEQQIADVDRIRRLLGREKLTLIGHSFGGFLAALYAAEFPDRVEKLILVSPAEMLVMPHPDGGVFEVVKKALPE